MARYCPRLFGLFFPLAGNQATWPSVWHASSTRRYFAKTNLEEWRLTTSQYTNANRISTCGHVPWAREVPFQTVHSVSRFLSLSNNLGNLLFARRTTPTAVSDRVLMRF